jgi:hypothetical protein
VLFAKQHEEYQSKSISTEKVFVVFRKVVWRGLRCEKVDENLNPSNERGQV